VGSKLPQAMQRLGGYAVAQKYEVDQNALFKKQDSKIFSPNRSCENVFPDLPREQTYPTILRSLTKNEFKSCCLSEKKYVAQ